MEIDDTYWKLKRGPVLNRAKLPNEIIEQYQYTSMPRRWQPGIALIEKIYSKPLIDDLRNCLQELDPMKGSFILNTDLPGVIKAENIVIDGVNMRVVETEIIENENLNGPDTLYCISKGDYVKGYKKTIYRIDIVILK